MSASASMFSQSFFHGTRADLKPGDLIVVGYQSNFTETKPLSWVYFAGTLDAAIWGAEPRCWQLAGAYLCCGTNWADRGRSQPDG